MDRELQAVIEWYEEGKPMGTGMSRGDRNG